MADLRLAGPRLRLSADTAAGRGGRWRATAVSASACGCADPPWRVTARSAEVVAGEGAWLDWPVFWAGPVPVAAAPWGYVPLARRRSGVLLPRLGWDGDHGPHGSLPVFWALGRSVDLTLAPGYRHGLGPAAGDAILRWAAAPGEGGRLSLGVVGAEGVVAGEGSLPSGSARLALEGAATTDAEVFRALRPGLTDRTRTHLDGALGAALLGRRVGAGLRVASAQSLDGAAGQATAPEIWARWSTGDGPATVALDAEARRLWADEGPAVDAFRGRTAADAEVWIGPLRVRPHAGLWTDVRGDDVASESRVAGVAAGTAEVALGRRYGAAHHRVGLRLDGRYARARGRLTGAGPPAGATDAFLDSAGGGVTLETAWVRSDAHARLGLRQGWEAEAPVEGRGIRGCGCRWICPGPAPTPPRRGERAGWARLRLGHARGAQGRLGWARVRRDADAPWLRPVGAVEARLQDGALTVPGSAEAGLTLPLGPARLDYDVAVDAEAGHLVGQAGALRWQGRCDCWHASLGVGHQRGRDLPDVWIGLGLEPDGLLDAGR
ncbi:MAG: LPS-assembly protein LptD [Myxococcales bacterium]|nr:LPS-assembly protein LptD [Myxococcales bacterium]